MIVLFFFVIGLATAGVFPQSSTAEGGTLTIDSESGNLTHEMALYVNANKANERLNTIAGGITTRSNVVTQPTNATAIPGQPDFGSKICMYSTKTTEPGTTCYYYCGNDAGSWTCQMYCYKQGIYYHVNIFADSPIGTDATLSETIALAKAVTKTIFGNGYFGPVTTGSCGAIDNPTGSVQMLS